jgi:hypothetical protein
MTGVTALMASYGATAEMVISDHSYHKVYRVTAMMRDTPTQYQLGSVYCIIEELM